jgi:hypothetical protein
LIDVTPIGAIQLPEVVKVELIAAGVKTILPLVTAVRLVSPIVAVAFRVIVSAIE